MEIFSLQPSRVLMLISGILLLLGVNFLAGGQYGVWIAAKIFYLFGIVLMLFNK